MTIVFVHGLGGAARLWERTRAALSPPRECLALELPGCGARAREAAPEDLEALVDDLEAQLRALERPEQPLVLVGHSLGGALVQRLCARRVEVAALVLVSTFLESPPGEALRQLLRDDEASFRALLLSQLYGTGPETALSQELFRETRAEVLAAQLGALSTFDGRAAAAAVRARRPTVRAVAIAGSRDPIANRRRHAALVEAWAAEERVLEAGHMLPDEAPAAVARAIDDVIAAPGRAIDDAPDAS
jgi:pimeloyl-ACP methyl ester carboxylesterase